jgi:hypothetical protein
MEEVKVNVAFFSGLYAPFFTLLTKAFPISSNNDFLF